MQGLSDILPHSDTKCRLSLGFPRDRGQAFRRSGRSGARSGRIFARRSDGDTAAGQLPRCV